MAEKCTEELKLRVPLRYGRTWPNWQMPMIDPSPNTAAWCSPSIPMVMRKD